MNQKIRILPVLYLLLGVAGAALYRAIFQTSVDEMALVVRGSLPEIALWVLTACAMIGAICIALRCRAGEAGAVSSVIGDVIFLLGIATLLRFVPKGPSTLVLLYRITVWAAMASLLAAVVAQTAMKKHFFVLDIAPCLLAILQMVECYQLWSEKPLLLHYFFGVGAVLTIMLFAFEKMASSSGLPQKKMYVFSGILGIFFCLVASQQAEFPIFFCAAAVWMASRFVKLEAAEG